jgi:phosphoglycerol transferase MdoB-like AlkP superfamily enzyme
MLKKADNLLLLLKRFVLLLLFYTIARILFLVFNAGYFSNLGFGDLILAFINGIRFDISTLVILNIPVIALHFFPFRFFYFPFYQKLIKAIFLLINIPCLLVNCIDFAYFDFTFHRTTFDVLGILTGGGDIFNTLPVMIKDFWYILIIWILLSSLLVKFYSAISKNHFARYQFQKGFIGKRIALHLLFTGLIVVGFRGGIQLKPLSIISAGQINSVKAAPLALNTPFTIIKTIGKKELAELQYFSPEEARQIFSPVHYYHSANSFSNLNVVIIILESFSKEYTGANKSAPGYTPFLDSLSAHSLYFTDAYANGKRSIDGIPAVVASIPSLSDDAFITSPYSTNTFDNLASLLKKKNYSTAFFHGGNNGTMGFDHFTRNAGFEKYYGRNEYNNDADFDGTWGIYDEEFLQFAVGRITEMRTPFFASIFTLSSHHPYSVPKKYKDKFPKGTLPIHESIGYADYSLKKFFETAQKQPWFSNTLFVITADHTALASAPFFHSWTGMFAIPLLYYYPNALPAGVSPLTTQQCDIVPSVLHYLNFDGSFSAFGNSVFDSSASHFAVTLQSNVYQIIENGYSLLADTSQTVGLYYFKTDSLFNDDLSKKNIPVQQAMEKKLHAFVQQFNHRMIHNKLKEE